MHFEIMRLSDAEDTVEDRTVVDATTVDEFVKQAAATGQRLYIRPVPTV